MSAMSFREKCVATALAPVNLHVLYLGLLSDQSDREKTDSSVYDLFALLKTSEAGMEALPVAMITAAALALGGGADSAATLQFASLATSVASMGYGFTMQFLNVCKDGVPRGPAGALAVFAYASVDTAWTVVAVGGALGVLAGLEDGTERDTACIITGVAFMAMFLTSGFTKRTATWTRTSAPVGLLFSLVLVPSWLLDNAIVVPETHTLLHTAVRRVALLTLLVLSLALHPKLQLYDFSTALMVLLGACLVHSAISVHFFAMINDSSLVPGDERTGWWKVLNNKQISALRLISTPFSCFLSLIRNFRSRSSKLIEQPQLEMKASQLRLKVHMLRGIEFEGKIIDAEGGECTVSFPGKYQEGWNGLVRKGHFDQTSIACVFLPVGSKRFGMHAPSDGGTEGWWPHSKSNQNRQCHCHAIYGEPKQWGCVWFELWCEKVRQAHKLNKKLQVYYFCGQKGQGKVRWEDCPKLAKLRDEVYALWPKDASGFTDSAMQTDEASMWEALETKLGRTLTEEERHTQVGLGGSQKAEVAWLDKNGFEYEDVDTADLLQGKLVSMWADEGEYHYLQLVPSQWSGNRDVEEVMDTGEGLLLHPGIASAKARAVQHASNHSECSAAAAVANSLESVLQSLMDTTPEQEPQRVNALLESTLLAFQQFKPQGSTTQLTEALQHVLTATDIVNPLTPSKHLGSDRSLSQGQPASRRSQQQVAVRFVPLLSVLHSGAWCTHATMPAAASELAKIKPGGGKRIDYLLSHAAVDSNWRKIFLLLQFLCLHEYMPSVLVSCSIIALTILPLGFIIHSQHAHVAWWLMSAVLFAASVPLCAWPYLCLSVLPVSIGPWQYMRCSDGSKLVRGTSVWLEAACTNISYNSGDPYHISAVTQALRESKSMVVFFSKNYLTQLRPVFELATYCRLHGSSPTRGRTGTWGLQASVRETSGLIFLGLGWSTYWHPRILQGAEAIELTASEKVRVESFSCRKAMCGDPSARAALLRAIRDDWGSEAEFDRFVRVELLEAVLRGKRMYAAQPVVAALAALQYLFGG
jgi:hypothetical protein